MRELDVHVKRDVEETEEGSIETKRLSERSAEETMTPSDLWMSEYQMRDEALSTV